MPGACVALVRLRRDTLEYFILGDCYLVVEDDAGLSMHTDPRVVNLDRLAIDELERSLAAGQMDFQSNREALLQILNRHRALQNRPGGYWLLGTEVEAVEHAIRGTCELDRTRSVLLMTDGFAELSSTFRVTERVADLLPLAREQGLGALHQQLKDLARADWECRAYPRLKRLDDASAVLLEFAPREDEGDSREST